jgi:hypothetical protein
LNVTLLSKPYVRTLTFLGWVVVAALAVVNWIDVGTRDGAGAGFVIRLLEPFAAHFFNDDPIALFVLGHFLLTVGVWVTFSRDRGARRRAIIRVLTLVWFVLEAMFMRLLYLAH